MEGEGAGVKSAFNATSPPKAKPPRKGVSIDLAGRAGKNEICCDGA